LSQAGERPDRLAAPFYSEHYSFVDVLSRASQIISAGQAHP